MSIQEVQEWMTFERQEKIDFYKKHFSEFSETSLLERINNPDKYAREAVIAAKELLKNKSKNLPKQ